MKHDQYPEDGGASEKMAYITAVITHSKNAESRPKWFLSALQAFRSCLPKRWPAQGSTSTEVAQSAPQVWEAISKGNFQITKCVIVDGPSQYSARHSYLDPTVERVLPVIKDLEPILLDSNGIPYHWSTGLPGATPEQLDACLQAPREAVVEGHPDSAFSQNLGPNDAC